jgi:flagellar L-ring protein precursor FlgH
MTVRTWILAASISLLAASPPAKGGSIYARARAGAARLYSDDAARNTGDTLTIVIEEQSKIENETTRKLDKSNSRSAKASGTFDLGNMISWLEGHIWRLPNADINHQASNKFDGKGEYESEKKVTDKITVTVQDVLPNGNLVVLGQRERMIAGDKQTIQASGIVRPSDVNFSNEVSSKKVADFKIVYKNHGQESHFVNPGWLARILNWLNPE